ncbi:PREDICTED: uncharacterized protein LOC104589047 [Nelumbo nucifera]|uniref:Uncharacterized protein LOC104589047 n=1 Tax=Nelumbo nucifera TaxID=4432 RepID=A0A1U7ZDQ5_NELNU|nr:PREDICTED: uncharacterized protein LOC104589047 [Nelumbo nucifera]
MGTAVLRSEDCLRDRIPFETLTSPVIRPRRNPNPNSGTNISPNSSRNRRRMRNPSGSLEKENGNGRCGTNVVKPPAKTLVMGQVTILKRGEELKPPKVDDAVEEVKKENDVDSVLCSTNRLGPEPEMVPKQIHLTDAKAADGDVFAGSVFASSPPPSSLPFPAFFTKKGAPMNNDLATNDLRRLLRLHLS